MQAEGGEFKMELMINKKNNPKIIYLVLLDLVGFIILSITVLFKITKVGLFFILVILFCLLALVLLLIEKIMDYKKIQDRSKKIGNAGKNLAIAGAKITFGFIGLFVLVVIFLLLVG